MGSQTEQLKTEARGLFRSTGLVACMTFLSRILGFVRDMVCAYYFGASAGYDAFLVAFKIPNFMRRLFAEGAFSQAFVPILSEYRETRSHEEVQDLVNRTAGTLGAALFIVTLIAVLAAPLLIMIFAPGFHGEATRFTMASDMLRITFPYLLLISLTAFAGAVLNTYGAFGVPAFTPVLLNLCLIGASIFLAPHFHKPVEALAWGVLAAGFVQLFFQFPFLKRKRLLPKPKISFRDPGVRRILKLMAPALLGVSVAQISLLLDTVFASFLKVGSVSWLFYSERLMSFPLGVFGVALSTVILPHLSRKHADKSEEQYSETLDWAIRSILLIGIPAAIGLRLLAGPLMATLFSHGHFGAYDVRMARMSLMAFSLGVPAFMMIKVLASGFYARQNIKAPVRIAVIALVINMILNLLLIIPLAHVGLALATALSGCVNASLLYKALRKEKIFSPQTGWSKYILQLLTANGALAGFLWWFSGNLQQWLDWHWQSRTEHLLLLVFGGMLLYSMTLLLVGLRFRDFKTWN